MKQRSFFIPSQMSTRSSRVAARPFCGWYDLVQMRIEQAPHFEYPRAGHRLLLLELNCAAFSARAVPEAVLARLDDMLGEIGRTHEIILRGVYDCEGRAARTEPKSFETVCVHLAQLGALAARHRDAILVYQGLMVGNWGEMHGSAYLRAEHLRRLTDVFFKACPEIPLALRTPAQRATVAAGRLKIVPRVGLFNDAIMGSENDLGTFDGSRERAAYLFANCAKTVPYGGETVLGNTFHPLALCQYAAKSGVSYLNFAHDPAAMRQLDAAFHTAGMTCRAWLGQNMGYLPVLCGAAVKEGALQLTVENRGFAVNYRPLKIIVEYASGEICVCSGPSVLEPQHRGLYAAALPERRGCVYARLTVGGRSADFANAAEKRGVLVGRFL